MRHILILLLTHTAFVGCHSLTDEQHTDHQMIAPQKTAYQTEISDIKVRSEAIVVFKKGTPVQTAKEIIEIYGMRVLKVYKGISESTHKPMLHVSSSLASEKMILMLRKDPKVSSVSPNYIRQMKE